MTRNADEASTYGAAMVAVGVVGAALAALAFVSYGGKAAASAAFGATLAVANLWVLGKVIRAMLPADDEPVTETAEPGGASLPAAPAGQKGSPAAWGVFALLKVLLLFGLVIAAVQAGWVTPLGFLAGYGALPLGIVMAQLARGMSAR